MLDSTGILIARVIEDLFAGTNNVVFAMSETDYVSFTDDGKYDQIVLHMRGNDYLIEVTKLEAGHPILLKLADEMAEERG